MPIATHTVDSLSAFIEIVAKIRDRWTFRRPGDVNTWFRGQRSAQWGLVPGLYRRRLPREDEMRVQFSRRARPLMNDGAANDDWDWYFTMQHYGLPTRLLDWTEGSLTALYFALRGNNRRSPAAVWMLDPWWLNGAVTGAGEIFFTREARAQTYLPPVFDSTPLPEHPLAVVPLHTSRRIVAQRSCFTVFGSIRNGIGDLAERDRLARLEKIEIAPEAFKRIRLDLYSAGITETSVFPDVEALSREIQEWSWGP